MEMLIKLVVFVIVMFTVYFPSFTESENDVFSNIRDIAVAMINTEITTGYRTNGSFLQDKFPAMLKFPCNLINTTSPTLPTSVHRLRPGDIDVIASIGDSLTSGAGAASRNLIEISIDNRGLSWSGGGQWHWRNVTTLPNILKKFNPYLVGYAKGDVLSPGKYSELNIAEDGYFSQQMPNMAKKLVKRIRNDIRIDFDNHWKMVTLMIGWNDLCKLSCNRTHPNLYPDEFTENIKKTLDYLKDNLPRTFVNLVPAPPIENILMLNDIPANCKLIQFMNCICFLYSSDSEGFLEFVRPIQERMWQLQRELAQTYRGLDNFTVVYQPFFEQFSIKKLTGESDFTLTAYDCFHLSQKGNAWAGISLWNNLLEPTRNKSKEFVNPKKKFLCPSANQFLPTYDNDDYYLNANNL